MANSLAARLLLQSERNRSSFLVFKIITESSNLSACHSLFSTGSGSTVTCILVRTVRLVLASIAYLSCESGC